MEEEQEEDLRRQLLKDEDLKRTLIENEKEDDDGGGGVLEEREELCTIVVYPVSVPTLSVVGPELTDEGENLVVRGTKCLLSSKSIEVINWGFFSRSGYSHLSRLVALGLDMLLAIVS